MYNYIVSNYINTMKKTAALSLMNNSRNKNLMKLIKFTHILQFTYIYIYIT